MYNAYSLLNNNCEHFATFARYGECDRGEIARNNCSGGVGHEKREEIGGLKLEWKCVCYTDLN